MTERTLPRTVWALGLVSLLMDTSSEMIHSLLPLFLTSVLGVGALSVGVIEGIAEATASVSKVFSGALSDRVGQRRPLILAGYGLAALTKPLFALAPTVGWVVGARFADRLGKGIRGAPRDALVADVTPAPMLGAAYGLRQALDTVGAVAGPLVATLAMAASADDFRLVFWIATVPAVLCVAVIVAGVEESSAHRGGGRPPPSWSELRRLPGAFWLVTAVAMLMTLTRFSEAFLLLRAQSVGVSPAVVPLVLVAMNVIYAVSSYPAGLLSDRLGRHGLLLAGFTVLVAADLVLASADRAAWVGAGALLWGLHMGLTQGLLSALVADAAPPDLRGTAFGVFHLGSGLMLLAASVLAGWLWSAFGPPMTFLAGAAAAALAVMALGVSRRLA